MDEAANRDVAALESALPEKLIELDNKVQVMFERSSVQLESTFGALLDPSKPATNDTLVEIISYARSEMAACVRNLSTVERYITLKIPAAEDGNNFGVAVQLEFNKMISERRNKIKELFDKLADYHKERAALWKEVAVKSQTEMADSQTKLSEDETKAETTNTVKLTTKAHSETKKTIPTPLPDGVASIVALDANWYFHLAFCLESVRDAYLACFDCIDKNRAKLERPKGEGAGGMSMF